MACAGLGALICAVTWTIVGGSARAAENYMIHRTEVTYEFIDADQIKVVGSGVRQALVTDVNVGRGVADTGAKVVARWMRFRCVARTASVVSQRTFSLTGRPLTEGGATSDVSLRAGDVRDQARFRFVCQDDRGFPSYFDENPVDSADKLYSLLHAQK